MVNWKAIGKTNAQICHFKKEQFRESCYFWRLDSCCVRHCDMTVSCRINIIQKTQSHWISLTGEGGRAHETNTKYCTVRIVVVPWDCMSKLRFFNDECRNDLRCRRRQRLQCHSSNGTTSNWDIVVLSALLVPFLVLWTWPIFEMIGAAVSGTAQSASQALTVFHAFQEI